MRRTGLAAAALVVAAVLAGCGGSQEPTGGESPATGDSPAATGSAEPSPNSGNERDDSDDTGDRAGGPTVEIEIEGDRVEPNGERVEVSVGEPLRLEIESDRAAELHVHSSPEQTLSIRPGESTKRLVIERPGVVEVEEHESGVVVLQLEVR